MTKKEFMILTSIITIVGCSMHFVCDIFSSDVAKNILGVIFPINETSWEHMKMIWYPFLGASIYLSISRKNIKLFGAYVIAGIVCMLIQLGVFAFYQSFTGHSVLFLDILNYFCAMIACSFLGRLLLERTWVLKTWYIWIALSVIVTGVIIFLTYAPGTGYVFHADEE